MPSKLETLDILNDLIQINSHWIEGYEQAAEELKVADQEMQILLKNLTEQNDEDIVTLPNSEMKVVSRNVRLISPGGRKISNTWREIKKIFAPKEPHKDIEINAVEKAHIAAMTSENLLSNLHEMIEGQKTILKTSRDYILASRGDKI